MDCFFHIPRTEFHKDPENAVAQLFWGRVGIENAAAFFYFSKGSLYQVLIHKLKYRGRKDIGIEMGRAFGAELKSSIFASANLILPVPLHPSKLKLRGYNQSEMIAEGLSRALEVATDFNILQRVVSGQSQTRKSRFDRYLNAEGKYVLSNPAALEGKHIIIVDDVVTTGSTLEACAIEILRVPGTRVSVLTLAVA
ncbi:MAG: ComF family protein [Bacteroidales bacterium]|nr:ComF family protein [Bacteroidales bacterium]MCB9000208.1 ComF family protein [Bacteroidales bacterium]MCB9013713.1 ComF family protein [Bacteroidales bacterium]